MNIQESLLKWMLQARESFLSHTMMTKSQQTTSAYRLDIDKFLAYLTKRGIKRITSLKGEVIEDYLASCKKEGKMPATVSRYYMSIRSFCRYLHKTKRLDHNVTENVTAPRCVLKAPKVPTVKEIQQIISMADVNTPTGVRDRAILELLYSSGLRASELCDLRLEDLGEYSIRIMAGKREKTRTIPITVYADKFIRFYLQEIRGNDEGWLFLTLKGKRIGRTLLCKIVTDYAKKAGVGNVSTHSLRHACATHLLDKGADLRLIQEVLGHTSIASTQRYTHLSSEKMQEMFHNFHPRKLANA